VNQTAERLLNDDPRDWVKHFAQPLALQAFGDLFEVTSAEDLNELGRLTRALPRAPDVESFARADGELLEFLRARPTLLLTPGVASELTTNDRLYLQRLFAQTGHESTAMAIALSLELLVTNDLPFDPSPRAVNELLRLTSPLIRFGREATQATTVSGVELPAGARLLVFFPLVNRDPAVFTDPHRIDLAREKNPHLSFGAGPHACYGADVARLVLSAALSAMSKRERPTRATGTPLISAVTRGLDSLLLR
jgi:cytochrome P450